MTSDVQISCVTEPTFGENAYLVWRDKRSECWIVDPGLPPSASGLIQAIEDRGIAPAAIVLTHAHADHIAGIPAILERWPALPVWVSAGEAKLLSDPEQNLSAWSGLALRIIAPRQQVIRAGDTLELDGLAWQVLDVAGHSPEGCAFYCEPAALVISGDALFAGSIGRTDFPHSDHARLISNIRNHLLPLPDDTVVLSGHGPPTTIERERSTNPFLT